MSGATLKDRLRTDLKAALQARDTGQVKLLRTLIAALDNAEAVAVADTPYRARAFGSGENEVARRTLDTADVDAVLCAEQASRLTAAADYEAHGRLEDAARLRDEAARIARYRLDDWLQM